MQVFYSKRQPKTASRTLEAAISYQRSFAGVSPGSYGGGRDCCSPARLSPESQQTWAAALPSNSTRYRSSATSPAGTRTWQKTHRGHLDTLGINQTSYLYKGELRTPGALTLVMIRWREFTSTKWKVGGEDGARHTLQKKKEVWCMFLGQCINLTKPYRFYYSLYLQITNSN